MYFKLDVYPNKTNSRDLSLWTHQAWQCQSSLEIQPLSPQHPLMFWFCLEQCPFPQTQWLYKKKKKVSNAHHLQRTFLVETGTLFSQLKFGISVRTNTQKPNSTMPLCIYHCEESIKPNVDIDHARKSQ